MECGACGKPISLTAKFCGKCGAPVKRPAPVAAEEMAEAPLLETVKVELPADADNGAQKSHPGVEDLVLTLDIPQAAPEHASMLKIDLDLVLKPENNTQITQEPVKPAAAAKPVTADHETVTHAQALAADSPVANGSMVPVEWLAAREQSESQIKDLLEKHSQLLDFISLNSQQLSHFQSLPNPTEQLLREMMERQLLNLMRLVDDLLDVSRISTGKFELRKETVEEPDLVARPLPEMMERQTQLAAQLHTLQEQLGKPAEPVVIKLPDEFKLTLEKQRIELQKAFSQNVAQNSSNVESANQQTMARIEALIAENTKAAQTLESNLAPLSASFNELKSKLQAISKKVDETAAKTAKVANLKQEDSTEGSGGFIIFVIGLLCGLTVVLSSLAIYNFLSRESVPAAKDGHEAAAADAGHDEPAHAAPGKDDAGHGSASSHDKPSSDSSSKAKSH